MRDARASPDPAVPPQVGADTVAARTRGFEVRALPIGLILGFLLFLFLGEPMAAATLGLLAFVGYAEIAALERRIRSLEIAQEPAREAPAVDARRPEPRIAPSTVAATVAAPISRPIVHRRAAPGPAAAAVPRPTVWDRWRSASLGEIEELVAGRLLAVIGGLALFLGGVFFLGLAFSRGWIGPELRVAIGLVAGTVLFALGGLLLRGRRQVVAHVLVAVGIGVFSLALFAATRLHGFFAPEFGVAAALMAAAAAAALAIRFDAPLVAAFGLVAVLGSPPVMGAAASLLTLAFIGAALAGTTSIALFRSWRWLPSLAFLLAAPQLAAYVLGDPPLAIGLGAIGGFWALNATAAAGEEILVRRFRLRVSSATLLLASAALVVALGFGLLEGDLERWRGLYLLAVAIAHLALATLFLIRETDRHPFGMLAAGTGLAAVTMAVPIQLGAEWVPLAWASEAVALAWIYVERRHAYSGLAALVLGTLAAGHILAIEYPLDAVGHPAVGAIPFVNPSGMALGFVVLAAAVATWVLRARHERVAVAAVSAGLVAVAIPHELGGIAEAMALTAVVTGGLIVQRSLLNLPLRLPVQMSWMAYADRALYGTAGIAALLLASAVFDALPILGSIEALTSTAIPEDWPFINTASAVAVIVMGGALSVAIACTGRWMPAGLLSAATAIAYLLPSQVGGAVAVAGWAALAIGLAAGARWFGPWLGTGARALVAAAALELLAVAAPVERLWVRTQAPDELAILNGGVLAAVAVATMLCARAVLPPRDGERRWAAHAAGVAAVYAVSIAVVDLFQAQVGGTIGVEELQKQAQVALSVLWAVIGALVTVLGLRVRRPALRLSGLGLLGIVTLKVFIVDLAALDITYRVLSFVALGILLLAAAYLYGRMQPDPGRR
jgi:uncharacterized membrane protein